MITMDAVSVLAQAASVFDKDQIRFIASCGLLNMSWRRATIAIPLIPTALALAVRFYGLSDKPLWLDEIITQRRANLPISHLIENSLYNKQFPTYFIFVRAFDAPIINEWTLRLPSAIFSAIAVLLVTLIATEIQSRRAGVIAG